MSSVSTFGSSDSMTSILPETLAPPMIATNGRFGLVERVAQEVELLLHQVARRALRRGATPVIELWARCAVPKASLT